MQNRIRKIKKILFLLQSSSFPSPLPFLFFSIYTLLHTSPHKHPHDIDFFIRLQPVNVYLNFSCSAKLILTSSTHTRMHMLNYASMHTALPHTCTRTAHVCLPRCSHNFPTINTAKPPDHPTTVRLPTSTTRTTTTTTTTVATHATTTTAKAQAQNRQKSTPTS